MRLKDVIETEDGELRVGDLIEKLRKELRKIKIIDNREEVFRASSKEYSAHFVRNDSDNRSRYNK